MQIFNPSTHTPTPHTHHTHTHTHTHTTHTHTQRLTRSLPGNQRDSVISQYVGEDLLGCSSPNSSHLATIIQLLQTTDPSLREQLARLFNTLASLTGETACSL